MESSEINVVHTEWFFHVRVLIGIVTGLAVGRVLTGIAGALQAIPRTNLIQFGWSVYLFVYIITFWWFEFALSGTQRWPFFLYAFVVFYAAYLFLMATFLHPDSKEEQHAFTARWRIFYGLLAGLYLVDLADTALKGSGHLATMGWAYISAQCLMALLAALTLLVRDRRYQAFLLVLAFIVLGFLLDTRFAYLDLQSR